MCVIIIKLQKMLLVLFIALLNKYQILPESLGEPNISNEILGGEGGVPNLAYPGDRCCTFYEDTGYVGD